MILLKGRTDVHMKKISLLGALSLNTSIPTPLMANTLNSSKNNIENNSTTYRR
jgi:hypothetical protein